MNYTQNYHLPQWDEDDRIMRTDFNNAMAAIESGMVGNRDATQNAQNTADEALKRPYATGTYIGNEAMVTVHLGFRPSFVIISGMEAGRDQGMYTPYFAMTAGGVLSPKVEFTDDGFTVQHDYSTGAFPRLSWPEHIYDYIAFK